MILKIILTYLAVEVIANWVFYFLNKQIGPKDPQSFSIMKGVLERWFLIAGLMYGFPQVIIAFAALKIGTRFQSNKKITNDYFLIGNFISLLAALVFVIICIRFYQFI